MTAARQPQLTILHARVLMGTVFIIAACGLIYELIVGTLSSYLFGNSVAHFSVTIGLFMSAMGIGSFASRQVKRAELEAFILVEMAIGCVGGLSAAILNAVFVTNNFYHLVMGILILIIGGLIGMEIPLLTRILGGWEAVKDTLANVLAIDYLGALLAAVLFPIFLLPQIGLLKTSFVTGLLNIAVVGVNIWIFRSQLKLWRPLAIVTGGVTVLLLAGFTWSVQLTSFFEERVYRDEIVYADQTTYQRIVLTRWGDDLRLFLDGNLQFSSLDEYRYHEMLVHPAMGQTRSRESVLVLGGGDGLVAREVFKYDDVKRLVLVDLDPAMTDLGQTHPSFLAINKGSLNDPRVEIINQDAFSYLAETSDRFGAIIIDLPDPNNESLGKLYSLEFYRLVQRHLAKGGIATAQATSPYFARETYWSIIHTAQDTGLNVYPYHTYIPSFGDWGFMLAAEHTVDFQQFEAQVPLRYLTSELLQVSTHFDNDTDEVEADISTLNNQVILTYYQKGWRRWN
ncbi:MAG: polyamine aminopropyltransferase [Chloroflexota bacterium]